MLCPLRITHIMVARRAASRAASAARCDPRAASATGSASGGARKPRVRGRALPGGGALPGTPARACGVGSAGSGAARSAAATGGARRALRGKGGEDEAPPACPFASTRAEGAAAAAAAHLAAADPSLRPLLARYAYAPPQPVACCFGALARTVVFQQLATKAARTIHGRFVEACTCPAERKVTPARVLEVEVSTLRAAGLSERKAMYIKGLAEAFSAGDGDGDHAPLSDERLRAMSDAELMASLTALKGFGCWSVHMFMIFSLGRPDILPTGDYGVRKGAMRHFGLSTMPTPAKLEALAAAWAPYRSVASHYMWRKAEE